MTMGAVLETVVPALNEEKVRFKITFIKNMGTYAAWKATKTTGQYDLKTFEVKATLVDKDKAQKLRPGMSVIIRK